MPIKIINSQNHNGFKIIPKKDNIKRQFILERYGYSYTMIDNEQPHYLDLCRNMSYPFGVEPGYYKAYIRGESIHIEYITQDEYNKNNNKSNPQEYN